MGREDRNHHLSRPDPGIRRQPSPAVVKSTRMNRTAVILVASLALLLGSLFVDRDPEDDASPDSPATSSRTTPEPPLRTIFRDGLNLFKEDKYEEAAALFEAIVAADPTHISAPKYLEACHREQRAVEALERARQALKEANLELTLQNLSEVPKTSLHHKEARRGLDALQPFATALEAVQAPGQADALKMVRDLAPRAEDPVGLVAAFRQTLHLQLEATVEEARAQIDTDPEEASRLALRGLAFQSFYPKQREALLDELETVLARVGHQAFVGCSHHAHAQDARLARAHTLFNEQNFEEATLTLKEIVRTTKSKKDRQQAASMLALIPRIIRLHEPALNALFSRNADDASDKLSVVEKAISKFCDRGKFHLKILRDLENLHTQLGRAAFNAKVYPVAFSHWTLAVDFRHRARTVGSQEDGGAAAEGLRKLQWIARDLYLRGFEQRFENPLEAKSLFKQAFGMTAPNDEFHRKANTQLRLLWPR